jgi:hypothetical protein
MASLMKKRTLGRNLCLVGCLLIWMHPVIAHCETKEFPLTTGRLFFPNTGTIRPQAPDLILHLHGAPGTVEKNIRRSHPDAIHVNITLPGLSSVYKKHFQDPSVFPSLLEETKVILSKDLLKNLGGFAMGQSSSEPDIATKNESSDAGEGTRSEAAGKGTNTNN